MALLTDLPNELLCSIAEHCDFTSLKRLRLQCKPLAACVTPLVFRHVYLIMLEPSLVKLENIAHSPHLRSHIRKLTFEPHMLPAFENITDYEEHIDLRDTSWYKGHPQPSAFGSDIAYREARQKYMEAPRHSLSDFEVQEGFTQFEEYSCFQRLWSLGLSTSPSRFTNAFNQLYDLKAVEVSDRYRVTSGLPEWAAIHDRIKISPTYRSAQTSGAPQCLSILEAVASRSEYFPTSLTLISDSDMFYSHRWLEDRAEDLAGDGSIAEQVQPIHMAPKKSFNGALRHLEEFRFEVWCQSNYINWAPCALVPLLHGAHVLRELDLQFLNSHYYRNDQATDIFRCLRLTETRFPSLQYLRIHGVNTNEEDILHFMKTNADTLRHIRLEKIMLFDNSGRWERLLFKMPRLLKLTTARFNCLEDEIFSDRAEDQKHFPLLPSNCVPSCSYRRAIEDYACHGADGREFPNLDRLAWADNTKACGGTHELYVETDHDSGDSDSDEAHTEDNDSEDYDSEDYGGGDSGIDGEEEENEVFHEINQVGGADEEVNGIVEDLLVGEGSGV
ncbi:hypothetical protein EJ08DRAFT_293639 [Tothia fuscella]|uniref:F-box domain-containing protein n=1 Tax=Tothia fuscella TaxID=1048955 RepID=A0A9P4P1V8_9PEZI|nr:hypothetical protein EJ08DRAFT_293639 [Tothia fuscella]